MLHEFSYLHWRHWQLSWQKDRDANGMNGNDFSVDIVNSVVIRFMIRSKTLQLFIDFKKKSKSKRNQKRKGHFLCFCIEIRLFLYQLNEKNCLVALVVSAHY